MWLKILQKILINTTWSNAVAVHVLREEMGSRRLIFNGLTTEAEYIKQETSEVSIQL